jgi:hypothetical protein
MMHRDALDIVDKDLTAIQSAIKKQAAGRLAEGAMIVTAEDGKVSVRSKRSGRVIVRSMGIYAQPEKTSEEVRVLLKPADAREDTLISI